MIVYGSSFSPYVRKALAFCHEKGVVTQVKSLGPGSTDPEFREASPFGKMPALRDGDFMVSDSSAIVAYLEAKQPDPNLIPTEARARARTIWFDEFADTILFSAAVKVFANRVLLPVFMKKPGDEVLAETACTTEIPPILDYLESQLPASGHLVEDRLTLADIAVASPLANLEHGRFRLDDARHPRVAAFAERILSRPSFTISLDRERRHLARAA